MTDIVQPVIDWVVGLMGILGGPGAGVAVALENLFPPIPSEVILPLAGFAAARGEMGLLEAIACSTLGSVVGALALYGLGAWFGRTRKVGPAPDPEQFHIEFAERAAKLAGQKVDAAG